MFGDQPRVVLNKSEPLQLIFINYVLYDGLSQTGGEGGLGSN